MEKNISGIENSDNTSEAVEAIISTHRGDLTESEVAKLSDREFDKIGDFAMEDDE